MSLWDTKIIDIWGRVAKWMEPKKQPLPQPKAVATYTEIEGVMPEGKPLGSGCESIVYAGVIGVSGVWMSGPHSHCVTGQWMSGVSTYGATGRRP